MAMAMRKRPINPNKYNTCGNISIIENNKPFKNDGLKEFFAYIDQFDSIDDVPKEILEYGRNKYFHNNTKASA